MIMTVIVMVTVMVTILDSRPTAQVRAGHNRSKSKRAIKYNTSAAAASSRAEKSWLNRRSLTTWSISAARASHATCAQEGGKEDHVKNGGHVRARETREKERGRHMGSERSHEPCCRPAGAAPGWSRPCR